jgi:ankyrin repeat protein
MLKQQAKEDPSSLEELGNLPTWTDQSSPLMYAAWGGNLEICQLLVEQGGANPLHTNARGETAVHWAAAAGHLDVCQYLVQQRYQKVLESPQLLDQALTLQHDHQGQTPFDYAFEYDREDIMEWMMQLL